MEGTTAASFLKAPAQCVIFHQNESKWFAYLFFCKILSSAKNQWRELDIACDKWDFSKKKSTITDQLGVMIVMLGGATGTCNTQTRDFFTSSAI